MSTTEDSRRAALDPAVLGFDPDALRARYRHERDRRLRPDGSGQYQETTGEFGYYADDPYVEPGFAREPLHDHVEVLVVGGGFGGLTAAARLVERGFTDIRVVEKAGDFGGTWYWNRYPGVHCDIESYIYLPLLEELGSLPDWKYSPGAEIRGHAQAIGHHFGLYANACFQTEVTDVEWDESATRWTVRTDRGDVMTARYVVVSSGPFSRPKLPGLPGIETFRGHTFHTSRWDYDYTGGDASGGMHKLADKRVAVIGTGATAIQCVPHLGQDAEHLYVFQRTPSSVDERGNRPTDREWATTLAPGWQRERRENFLTLVTGGHAEQDLVGDRWTDSVQTLRVIMPSEDNAIPEAESDGELLAELADFAKMNSIRSRVEDIVEDPATAEALKPWYRRMCKRPTFSDTYLPTFNRPNVTLVDTGGAGVERITERGLVSGGVEYEVDCIVFATGFDLGAGPAAAAARTVRGRDGRTLAEHWSTGLKTLHGFYSHGFPNYFRLGASQNATSVNFAHVLDEQSVHVAEVIAAARDRGARYVEPSERAEAAWVATIREKEQASKEFFAECTPSYYNNEGRPRQRSESYGGGPVEFYRLLRTWRAETDMTDVLVEGDEW
ncbi:NAD(P)/FAD-dependent oxidoreductase [Saccharopolyspora sp. NFXS83]|uniref:flavin-containing monooxygenase n=1 Tax=Saccharopolyspora sp. NFXS83 TaxID=2993560 RepID=UPI00224A9E00|nr:NAD(P)/FAD-dependent oxidoreductase [Saccharopolyspora sp. NFXS83]MCX2730200.1 NAD(P)/FAD-dependent oxidoreductase [Saccharopolyspora sp. NFXS83]